MYPHHFALDYIILLDMFFSTSPKTISRDAEILSEPKLPFKSFSVLQDQSASTEEKEAGVSLWQKQEASANL